MCILYMRTTGLGSPPPFYVCIPIYICLHVCTRNGLPISSNVSAYISSYMYRCMTTHVHIYELQLPHPFTMYMMDGIDTLCTPHTCKSSEMATSFPYVCTSYVLGTLSALHINVLKDQDAQLHYICIHAS